MLRIHHHRSTELDGFEALKRGTPSALHDIYYSAMELSWPLFVAAVFLVFLAVNGAFAMIYSAMPGAILNARPGSLADSFFFSVETLATVGFGHMAPATDDAHWVATVEIMVGMLLMATVTGLTFARFARPRESLVFSNVAIVGDLDGREALMVRVASLRSHPIADVTAQMAMIERQVAADGRVSRKLVELPLIRQRNAMLTMTWTLAHPVEPGGILREALLNGSDIRIMVSVGGVDTLLSTPTFGGRFYAAGDILADCEFEDMIVEKLPGAYEVDLGKLHSTKPRRKRAGPLIQGPACSAAG